MPEQWNPTVGKHTGHVVLADALFGRLQRSSGVGKGFLVDAVAGFAEPLGA